MRTIYAEFLAISLLIAAIAVSCGTKDEPTATQPPGTAAATQTPSSTRAPTPSSSYAGSYNIYKRWRYHC